MFPAPGELSRRQCAIVAETPRRRGEPERSEAERDLDAEGGDGEAGEDIGPAEDAGVQAGAQQADCAAEAEPPAERAEEDAEDEYQRGGVVALAVEQVGAGEDGEEVEEDGGADDRQGESGGISTEQAVALERAV